MVKKKIIFSNSYYNYFTIIIIVIFILSFAVVLPFTHAGVFLFAIIIYQWDQNMEQSFKNGVAAAAMKYCATAQCYPNQSR